MQSASRDILTELNYVDHYTVTSPENFFFKKVLLALDVITPRVGNNDARFNSHSGFSGCHIPRLENYALIPFTPRILG